MTAAAATAPANAGARQASLSVLAAGLVLLLAAERGGVLGAVCFVNYAGLGVPVIGAGVLSPWTGRKAATTAAEIVIAAGCALLIPLVIRQRA